MLFLPDLFQVMSNGRIVCSYNVEDRTLLRHFKDMPPSVYLHPNAITRLDELNQEVFRLAALTNLRIIKKLVFLPQVRTSASPLNMRTSKHDYLSLFVDIFSLGFGLSSLRAAHFAKIILEELIAHFLPDDFPIDRASFDWMSFGDIGQLNDPRIINVKPFKELRGNIDADPTTIFEKLLPSASIKDRSLKRVERLIKLQDNSCNKWTGFISRNHFLNLYLCKDIPVQDLNDFSNAVKNILVQHCQFFPQQTAKSTALKAHKKFLIYTI